MIDDKHEVENTLNQAKDTFTNSSTTETLTNQYVSPEDLYLYIGNKNLDYYYKIFENHRDTDNFVSWNWCSFFFTPFWLLYRKMYIWFLIFMVLESILDTFSFMFPGIGSLLKIALMVIFGLFGNSIYLNSAKHRIRKITKIFTHEKHKNGVLVATGGTCITAPLVLFAILGILTLTMGVTFGVTLGSILSNPLSNFLAQINISPT